MAAPTRAVLFQHDTPVSAGSLERALGRAGFVLERRFREVRRGDAEADLVVVLGGFMGVYEAAAYPFLREELALLEERLGAQRPCLGICLGAQMLAAVAGARVYPDARGMVVRVGPVALTPAGRAHPAFPSGATSLEVLQWHGDTFDAVPGAQALGVSERHPQAAFCLGRSLGVLFHPEVEAPTFEAWARGAPQSLARAGRSLEEVLARDVPRLRAAQGANERFLEGVADHLAHAVGARRPAAPGR